MNYPICEYCNKNQATHWDQGFTTIRFVDHKMIPGKKYACFDCANTNWFFPLPSSLEQALENLFFLREQLEKEQNLTLKYQNKEIK